MTPLPYESWRDGMEGVFLNMPEDVYRKAIGVNVSSLKEMRLSPAHYKYDLEEEDDERKLSCLVTGTLVHRARLEPASFPGCYVVRPPHWDSWRTKDAQQWRDAQKLPVLTPDEEQVVLKCAKALQGVPILNQMASVGFCELSGFKRHELTGLMCKARGDVVAHDGNGKRWGLDIKTVLDGMAERNAFSKRIADYCYHQQDAFYTDLFELDHFVFCAVEKKGFPGVGLYELEAEDRELGRRANEAALQRISECRLSDIWPSYPPEIRSIGLPRWKRKQESEDVE